VEIWNIVFNEYYQYPGGRLEKLKVPGVDTGMGLERLAMMVQKKPTIFETDLFEPTISLINRDLPERIQRIIADHARGLVFLIADGVRPSNKEAGYILRRLLRRVIAYAAGENIRSSPEVILGDVVRRYKEFPEYTYLDFAVVETVYKEEYEKFIKSVTTGLKEIECLADASKTNPDYAFLGKKSFDLYQSHGVPIETFLDEFRKRKIEVDIHKLRAAFDAEFKKHQEISRAGVEKKFGGHGLVLDTGELKAGSEEELRKVTRLHTATHMLHQALREVLGPDVQQRGSDITTERTRFDFIFPRKVTPEELKAVEGKVNEKVVEDLPVQKVVLPKAEAEKTGALYFFKGKYPDPVNVYFVGRDLASAWSKEFCGGPHVAHTGEVGKFKILKEEASSAGVRRIRATIT
jgi:alanyl-tRNA synthetase